MTSYQDRAIKLASLVDPRTNRLSGASFEGCEIQGPAVLLPLRDVSFIQCVFGPNTHWSVPKGTKVEGVVGLEACHFERCEFLGVGVLGTPEQRAVAMEHTA